MKLDEFFTLCQDRLKKIFTQYLLDENFPENILPESMLYSLENGGKRIRPLLVYATGFIFKTPWENLDAPAAALEIIHSYSLIHDDLPAMDNSDTRRGKPSCHKAFNEATAILAGDALQTLAFEILASHPSALSNADRLEMIKTLSRKAGLQGMASGQMLDLSGTHNISNLEKMYELKTGALLLASVQLGLIASQNPTEGKALETYIQKIGLAFQIQDDLLDIEGQTDITGKPKGLDQLNQKKTYPNFIGIEKTKTIIQTLFQEAIMAIDFLGNNAEILRELAYYLLHRKK